GGVEALGARVRALEDARRLAAAAAQVIELGAAHLAAAQHLDLGDVGRVDREYALDALAVGDLAHREALVEAAAGAGDDHALVGLQAKAGPLVLVLRLGRGLLLTLGVLDVLDHLHHHLDGVAGGELRYAPLGRDGIHLAALEVVDDGQGCHGIYLRSGSTQADPGPSLQDPRQAALAEIRQRSSPGRGQAQWDVLRPANLDAAVRNPWASWRGAERVSAVAGL